MLYPWLGPPLRWSGSGSGLKIYYTYCTLQWIFPIFLHKIVRDRVGEIFHHDNLQRLYCLTLQEAWRTGRWARKKSWSPWTLGNDPTTRPGRQTLRSPRTPYWRTTPITTSLEQSRSSSGSRRSAIPTEASLRHRSEVTAKRWIV